MVAVAAAAWAAAAAVAGWVVAAEAEVGRAAVEAPAGAERGAALARGEVPGPARPAPGQQAHLGRRR